MINIIEEYMFSFIEENLDNFSKQLIKNPKNQRHSNIDFILNVIISVIY